MGTSWTTAPFSALASVRSGYAFKSSEWRLAGIAVVKIGNVKSGRLDMAGCSYVDPEVARASGFMLARGDILVGLTGYVGDCAVVRGEGPLVLNQRVGKISPRAGVDPDFVYYVISDPEFRAAIERASHGSAQANVSPGAIEAIPVRVPPIAEQRAIARILGALDDKIELNRKTNATLEAMARALFKSWFVDFDPVRAKAEGRAPSGMDAETAKLFPSEFVDSELGTIPKGWSPRAVGDLAVLSGGKQLERELIFDTGSIPVFGGAGIMGFTAGHNADGFVISVGRVGAYCGQFFSHRGKAWINNNASLIRPNDERTAEWMFIALKHADMNVIKKGAAQPFVSNGDIANLKLLWPGERTIAAFSSLLVPLLNANTQNDTESTALARLRDALLPRLLSGELSVRDVERDVEAVA